VRLQLVAEVLHEEVYEAVVVVVHLVRREAVGVLVLEVVEVVLALVVDVVAQALAVVAEEALAAAAVVVVVDSVLLEVVEVAVEVVEVDIRLQLISLIQLFCCFAGPIIDYILQMR